MHVSDLLSFLVTGDPLSADERAEVRNEVSFSAAVDGHLAWRQCLIDTVVGSAAAPMHCVEVCDETGCLLGRWLDGAGKRRYGDLPSFGELGAQHSRFHQLACEILELSSSGRKEEAMHLIDGEFLSVSTEIIARMQRLRSVFGS